MRNLLLFVLLLLGIWWVRRALSSSDRQTPGAEQDQHPHATPPHGDAERMRACAHCGVLVPESEGVSAAGAFYCGPEHARLGPRDDTP